MKFIIRMIRRVTGADTAAASSAPPAGPNARTLAGYALFFVLAFAVFVYVRFPAASLIPAVEGAVSGTPLRLEISGASLGFPPGVTFGATGVYGDFAGKTVPLVTLDYLSVTPSLLSIVSGPRATIKAGALNGEAAATVSLSGEEGKTLGVNFKFTDIDPAAGPWWRDFTMAKFSGKLSGGGAVSLENGDITRGDGAISLSLRDGVIEISRNILQNMPPLKIDSGALEADYKKASLVIKKGSFTGPDIEGTVAGSVILSRVPDFSRLNITVSVKLSRTIKDALGPLAMLIPPAKNGLHTFRIGGMIKSPALIAAR